MDSTGEDQLGAPDNPFTDWNACGLSHMLREECNMGQACTGARDTVERGMEDRSGGANSLWNLIRPAGQSALKFPTPQATDKREEI